MNKIVYQIMGIIVTFALTMGGFTKVQAAPSQPAASRSGLSTPITIYGGAPSIGRINWDRIILTVLLHFHCLPERMPMVVMPYPIMRAINCSMFQPHWSARTIRVPLKADIRTARGAGITGFWLNWSGDGTTSQTRTSCDVHAPVV